MNSQRGSAGRLLYGPMILLHLRTEKDGMFQSYTVYIKDRIIPQFNEDNQEVSKARAHTEKQQQSSVGGHVKPLGAFNYFVLLGTKAAVLWHAIGPWE